MSRLAVGRICSGRGGLRRRRCFYPVGDEEFEDFHNQEGADFIDSAVRRVSEAVDGVLSRRWVWAPGDSEPSAELSADGTRVTKRLYHEGEIRYQDGVTSRYHYARDILGSIGTVFRETSPGSVEVETRFDYDEYGQRTRLQSTWVSGRSVPSTFEPAFGYTGHLSHPGTGLVLTWYRAYDPETSRWLSRDPIWEQGGMNLYGYVGGSPLMAMDLLGLCGVKWPTEGIGNVPARDIVDLSKLIYSEAKAGSYDDMYAVGSVVRNRVSKRTPTLHRVIFQEMVPGKRQFVATNDAKWKSLNGDLSGLNKKECEGLANAIDVAKLMAMHNNEAVSPFDSPAIYNYNKFNSEKSATHDGETIGGNRYWLDGTGWGGGMDAKGDLAL